MSNLQSFATGNFTAAGTWLVSDATGEATGGATATTVGNVAGTVTDSATFAPGIITIQGIAIQLSRRIGTTGTMSVILRNSTGSIDVATVTVNCSDLPAETAVSTNAAASADGSWHFFDFVTPVTILGATNYLVRVVTSSATQVALLGGASNNWNRLIITTTTGAPAVTDKTYIGKGYTGAGTGNSYTVTQNNNDTTGYGALTVSNGGTLNATVAAATQLRLAGALKGWAGATVNFGTSGSPCVLNQATILEFNSTSDGQYGMEWFWSCNRSFYGASKTASIVKLVADVAAAGTSATIDTNVGTNWLNGDTLCFASTTRTAAESETKTLGAASSGTSLPTITALTNAHGGNATTGVQGHVANLTRDLKIRSVAASATTNGWYEFFSANYTGTATTYWSEYVNCGSAITNKFGMYNAATGGTYDAQYNSFHDFTEGGSIMIDFVQTSGLAYTFSNNVVYNTRLPINAAGTTTTPTISGNLFILSAVASIIGDVGMTFTNNTFVSSTTNGLTWGENASTIGTHSGTNCYANTAGGVTVVFAMAGTITNLSCWRNTTQGFSLAGTSHTSPNTGLIFASPTFFGNSTVGLSLSNAFYPVIITNGVFDGGATLVQPVGISNASQNCAPDVTLRSCTFGATNAHTTADINNISNGSFMIIRMENCLLNSTTEVGAQTAMSPGSFFQSDRHDQTAGSWMKWQRFGTLQQDTVVFESPATRSVKGTPNNASNKLEGDKISVPVNSGQVVTFSIRVRKGTSYNGAELLLVNKRNDAIGITSDTTIGTGAAAIGTWETLSGATAAATEDGCMDFVIQGSGTAGTFNYGNFSATVA